MGKRILLTGASGFLGRLSLRQLRTEGHSVVGLDPPISMPRNEHRVLVFVKPRARISWSS